MRLVIYFLIGCLSTVYSSSHAQSTSYKRYSLKSAIVEYKMSGMQTGTATLYFDEFGMKEATYENTVMELYGVKVETKTVNYLMGYLQYSIDRINNTATKTKNTMLESLVENSKGDLEEVGQEMFISMGGKMTGSEEMIGKPCEIWVLESLGTKVWVWKNIPLRTETNMMGIQIVKVATSLKENVEIPKDKLEVPANVEFTEIDLNNLNKMIEGF